jgi:IMP dehydrogenase
VLNLEGIWTRYEDADAQLERIAGSSARRPPGRCRRSTGAVKEELIAQRIQEIKAHGVVAAASLTPQKVERYYELVLDAGLDILVVQGTVISAEHVSTQGHVLNLKEFVAELPIPVVLGGCASYHTGLHLMRTGAAACSSASAPARPAHARRARHRRPAGDRDRRRRGRALAAHARDGRVLQGDRRRRHAQRAATSPRRSPAAPTR